VLSIDGPDFVNAQDASKHYWADSPLFCLIGTEHSDEVWGVIRNPGRHSRETFSSVTLARLVPVEGDQQQRKRFDPATTRQVSQEDKEGRPIEFSNGEGGLIPVRLRITDSGRLHIQPDGTSTLHVFANNSARINSVHAA
jgi:hypothetical protein